MDPFLSFIPTACAEGHFGKNCSFSCKCKNGASCDPVNGNCRCPPGVSGDLCQDGETLLFVSSLNAGFPAKIKSNYFKGTLDILHLQRSIFFGSGCPKGFYGKQCNKKCNCANNGRCHRTYGACLCDAGLYGRFCHLSESHRLHVNSFSCWATNYKRSGLLLLSLWLKYPWFLHLRLQRVPSGLLDPAVLKSVSVTSRTLSSVTAATAPVSVKLVTMVTPARKVSTVTKHKLCLCLYLYSCCLLQLYKYKTQKLQLPLEGQELYRNFDVLFC